jgi:hypothetical protein
VNGATVEIDANGQLGIKNSSARYKRDIAPMGTSSEKVLDLHPVTFVYKDDAQRVTRYGLIAEEVATVYPELVTRTATGEVQTVKYQELIPMLLNELQRQRQEFQLQLAELRALVGQGRWGGGAHPERDSRRERDRLGAEVEGTSCGSGAAEAGGGGLGNPTCSSPGTSRHQGGFP